MVVSLRSINVYQAPYNLFSSWTPLIGRVSHQIFPYRSAKPPTKPETESLTWTYRRCKPSPPDTRVLEASLADPDSSVWSCFDRHAPAKVTLSIRVNDYHLAMIRHLTDTQDTTQNLLLRRLLLPEIEQLAVGTARQVPAE